MTTLQPRVKTAPLDSIMAVAIISKARRKYVAFEWHTRDEALLQEVAKEFA